MDAEELRGRTNSDGYDCGLMAADRSLISSKPLILYENCA